MKSQTLSSAIEFLYSTSEANLAGAFSSDHRVKEAVLSLDPEFMSIPGSKKTIGQFLLGYFLKDQTELDIGSTMCTWGAWELAGNDGTKLNKYLNLQKAKIWGILTDHDQLMNYIACETQSGRVLSKQRFNGVDIYVITTFPCGDEELNTMVMLTSEY